MTNGIVRAQKLGHAVLKVRSLQASILLKAERGCKLGFLLDSKRSGRSGRTSGASACQRIAGHQGLIHTLPRSVAAWFFLHQLLADRQRFLLALGVGLGVVHVQGIKRIQNDPGDNQPGVLLVVGGHYIPGRAFCARCVQTPATS